MYRLYVSKNEMKSIGFKYDYILKDYVYEFPVYKYNKKPIITCKLGVDLETYEVWYGVYSQGNMYAAYYDREFSTRNNVVKEVEKNIKKEFKRLGVTEEREWWYGKLFNEIQRNI